MATMVRHEAAYTSISYIHHWREVKKTREGGRGGGDVLLFRSNNRSNNSREELENARGIV